MGSVAQIVKDSLSNSMVLVDVDKQAPLSDLPHDELVFLQRSLEAARFVAHLV